MTDDDLIAGLTDALSDEIAVHLTTTRDLVRTTARLSDALAILADTAARLDRLDEAATITAMVREARADWGRAVTEADALETRLADDADDAAAAEPLR